jgi:hypothetical protein
LIPWLNFGGNDDDLSQKWETERRKIEQEGPKLTDVGTRYQHYTDLRDLFRNTSEILRSRGDLIQAGKDKLFMLDGAVKAIESQIDIMAKRSTRELSLAKQVNGIEKDPQVWKGGRGTELKARRT